MKKGQRLQKRRLVFYFGIQQKNDFNSLKITINVLYIELGKCNNRINIQNRF